MKSQSKVGGEWFSFDRSSWSSAAGIAKGSIYLTLRNTFSTIIAVLGFAFMARAISQEKMGVIAGATLLAGLVQLVSDFGLNTSIHGKMDFDQALLIRG